MTNDNFAIIKVAVLHLDGSDACLSDINGGSILSNSYSHHLYAFICFYHHDKNFLGVLRKCSKENAHKLHLPHRLYWSIYTYICIFSRFGGTNIIQKNPVACEGVMLGTVSTFYDVDAVLIAVSAWSE